MAVSSAYCGRVVFGNFNLTYRLPELESQEPGYIWAYLMKSLQTAYFGVALFLTIDAGFIILIYASQHKLPEIEKRLNNCTWINDNRTLWQYGGLVGKIHRISIIYIILLTPQFWHTKKAIDLTQIQSLPKELRRWVQIPLTVMLLATAALVLMSPWILSI